MGGGYAEEEEEEEEGVVTVVVDPTTQSLRDDIVPLHRGTVFLRVVSFRLSFYSPSSVSERVVFYETISEDAGASAASYSKTPVRKRMS